MLEKGNKRTITGWVFYDWANSVYPLIISSAIFPILYETQTSVKNEAGHTIYDTVSFLGLEFHNTEFYAYVICLSYLVVAMVSPLPAGVTIRVGMSPRAISVPLALRMIVALSAPALGS